MVARGAACCCDAYGARSRPFPVVEARGNHQVSKLAGVGFAVFQTRGLTCRCVRQQEVLGPGKRRLTSGMT